MCIRDSYNTDFCQQGPSLTKSVIIGRTSKLVDMNEDVCGIELPLTEGFSVNDVTFWNWNGESMKKGAICSGGTHDGGRTVGFEKIRWIDSIKRLWLDIEDTNILVNKDYTCLLYTSPSPRDS
eukprot:TRINITY_DN5868_c0_g1_i4.p1 TRINITY_DN5868_c0_g1~~TRINITY_DN5868_c0_g1_i4.p1  ORF type:complete len:123 (+),score=30.52 TRINITY_DN5868_c0_g1_i4:64-432(+)